MSCGLPGASYFPFLLVMYYAQANQNYHNLFRVPKLSRINVAFSSLSNFLKYSTIKPHRRLMDLAAEYKNILVIMP